MTKREFLDTVFTLAPNEANAIMDAFDEYVESNVVPTGRSGKERRMTKYIIDIPDDIQYVLFNGKADNKYYTAVRPIAELEELNSDYINEHYGELQDEAYQRGFEDSKKSTANGCTGCKYETRTSCEEPCKYCSNCHTSKYTPMPENKDRIEVGDIVDVYGSLGGVTYMYELKACVMMVEDGSSGNWNLSELKKTGKHYDIASILEAMRE